MSKNKGKYSIKFQLDKCGTTVTQSNDKIIFTNSIFGNTDALSIQGIVTTNIIGFPVSCTYDDSFQLEINPIYLNPADVDTEGIYENGNVSSKFVTLTRVTLSFERINELSLVNTLQCTLTKMNH